MNVRDQVVRFLKTHPSINAVNFKFRQYKIWPNPYRMDQDRLEISPTTNFASLRHQGYVLHECTHAVLDMRAIGEHSGFDDETVAYLAQAFFLTRTLGDAGTTPDIPVPLSDNDSEGAGIYREAKRIAAKAMRTGAYYIEEKDAANLVLLVANQSIYQDKPRYPSNRFNRSFLCNLARIYKPEMPFVLMGPFSQVECTPLGAFKVAGASARAAGRCLDLALESQCA